jgi:hypothetical protein
MLGDNVALNVVRAREDDTADAISEIAFQAGLG